MLAANRAVDLIEERIDVALRVRLALDSDASLTMRTLARSRWILVAGAKLASAIGTAGIEALAGHPTLGASDQAGETVWDLIGPEGQTHALRHEPRFGCSDFAAIRETAAANMGVALLPDHACTADLASGRLIHLFPDWHTREGVIHIVFTTRRGLPQPSARSSTILPLRSKAGHCKLLAQHIRSKCLHSEPASRKLPAFSQQVAGQTRWRSDAHPRLGRTARERRARARDSVWPIRPAL
jgi:hypothetical protein